MLILLSKEDEYMSAKEDAGDSTWKQIKTAVPEKFSRLKEKIFGTGDADLAIQRR